MRMPLHLASLLVLALFATPTLASPLAASLDYRLGDPSAVQSGCLPPCTCPVLLQAIVRGGFRLEPDAFDGRFQHYRVVDLRWAIGPGDAVGVSGTGSYRVAGDQQQLVLDLSVAGQPSQHFDSGLTAGGSSFPKIRLPVALNGFHGEDTVFGVDAAPSAAGVEPQPEPQSPAFMLRLGPNPFHGSTQIVFSLPKDGPVDLRVLDIAGRVVRTLASRMPMGTGLHALSWDGRRDDGDIAPAGVYFVRLKTPDRETKARLTEL